MKVRLNFLVGLLWFLSLSLGGKLALSAEPCESLLASAFTDEILNSGGLQPGLSQYQSRLSLGRLRGQEKKQWWASSYRKIGKDLSNNAPVLAQYIKQIPAEQLEEYIQVSSEPVEARKRVEELKKLQKLEQEELAQMIRQMIRKDLDYSPIAVVKLTMKNFMNAWKSIIHLFPELRKNTTAFRDYLKTMAIVLGFQGIGLAATAASHSDGFEAIRDSLFIIPSTIMIMTIQANAGAKHTQRVNFPVSSLKEMKSHLFEFMHGKRGYLGDVVQRLFAFTGVAFVEMIIVAAAITGTDVWLNGYEHYLYDPQSALFQAGHSFLKAFSFIVIFPGVYLTLWWSFIEKPMLLNVLPSFSSGIKEKKEDLFLSMKEKGLIPKGMSLKKLTRIEKRGKKSTKAEVLKKAYWDSQERSEFKKLMRKARRIRIFEYGYRFSKYAVDAFIAVWVGSVAEGVADKVYDQQSWMIPQDQN